MALPMRLALAALALTFSAFLFVQLAAEKRLKDSRDVVYEVLERGDPRREQAIADLRDVADVQPGTEALLLASQARSSRGEDAAGVALARRAVDREPEGFQAWLTLAVALKDVNRREALRALERASELNPRYRTPPLD
jgi:tetratricopeptide (TPR) repeat protein